VIAIRKIQVLKELAMAGPDGHPQNIDSVELAGKIFNRLDLGEEISGRFQFEHVIERVMNDMSTPLIFPRTDPFSGFCNV
jgi:hypothetical protein